MGPMGSWGMMQRMLLVNQVLLGRGWVLGRTVEQVWLEQSGLEQVAVELGSGHGFPR